MKRGIALQDHEYSVGGHRRSTIGRYLGIVATVFVSLLPAVGIGLSELIAKVGLPEWSKFFVVIPLTASLTYTALYWFFNKYGWRPLSLFAQVPNISGEWDCAGQTIGEDGQVTFDWSGELTISQTWEKIRVKLETKSSISHSLSVALIPEPDGCWMLMYSYQNTPKVGYNNLNAHIGYAEIRCKKDLKTGNGEYFTAKGRGTAGRMTFTRRKG